MYKIIPIAQESNVALHFFSKSQKIYFFREPLFGSFVFTSLTKFSISLLLTRKCVFFFFYCGNPIVFFVFFFLFTQRSHKRTFEQVFKIFKNEILTRLEFLLVKYTLIPRLRLIIISPPPHISKEFRKKQEKKRGKERERVGGETRDAGVLLLSKQKCSNFG